MKSQKGLFGCPKAILVGGNTASSAEIVADVVLSWCPDTVSVGQQTYGKFAGTAYFSLGMAKIQVSSEIWVTGRRTKSLNYQGIIPDIVTSPGQELEVALKYIKNKSARTEPAAR